MREPIPAELSGLAPVQPALLAYRAKGRELAVVFPVTKFNPTPTGRSANASASDDRTVRVREASTGQELMSLPGVRHPVYTLAFNADGRQLASGCQASSRAGQVLVWGGQ